MTRHVIVHGRVQGVGFRAFVEYEARRLGLSGFVRNRHDGTVEALFAGNEQTVRQMIELTRQGPRGARVDGIDERDGDPADAGSDFEVRRTA
jgi:acylphosphatase